jgi:hypothetical protein
MSLRTVTEKIDGIIQVAVLLLTFGIWAAYGFFPISGSVRCSVIRAICGAGRRIHANYTKDAEEPRIVTAVAPRLSRDVLSS